MINELKLRIKKIFGKYEGMEQWNDLAEDYHSVSLAIHKLELEGLITRDEYIELDEFIEKIFESTAMCLA